MILLIDNYDSFTYNLAQLLGGIGRQREELSHELIVVRNDRADVSQLAAMNPDFLIVSPGPCTPKEAGVSNAAIRHFHGRIPILGVCLGHQCIAEVFGARVERADRVMHGKTSEGASRRSDDFSQACPPVHRHAISFAARPRRRAWDPIGKSARGRCTTLACE